MNKRKIVNSDWEMGGTGFIADLDELSFLRIFDGKSPIVCFTSGGFDSIHPGHISSFLDGVAKAKAFHQEAHGLSCPPNALLVVAVNGTAFLKAKKSIEFMDLKTRCQVVSCIEGVDFVVPFTPSDPKDMSVCEALDVIKPTYFLKGGDRDLSNIPEVEACKRNGTHIITNCGLPKLWSSSDFLNTYYSTRREQESTHEAKS